MNSKARLTLSMFSILLLALGSALAAAQGAQDAEDPLALPDSGEVEQICAASNDCGPGGPGGGGGGGGGGGTCDPDYQPVGYTTVGGYDVKYIDGVEQYCDYYEVYDILYSDVNNCDGSSDYTVCAGQFAFTRNDWRCCDFYWCGGVQSCS